MMDKELIISPEQRTDSGAFDSCLQKLYRQEKLDLTCVTPRYRTRTDAENNSERIYWWPWFKVMRITAYTLLNMNMNKVWMGPTVRELTSISRYRYKL